jgi:hypothetical protein
MFIQYLMTTRHHASVRRSFAAMLLLALVMLMPTACVDEEFDAPPPGGEDPNLTVNATIADLKAMHTLGQYEEITEDLVISALVVSNDREGNFYKQLIIQDSTGGIELRIDVTDLYTLYPVGRKVYLKAKGLWLGDFNGLVQLGISVGTDDDGDPELTRIPQTLVSQYLIQATYGHTVVANEVTIDELSTDLVSTLVTFRNVQFITADTGETWADPVLELSVNREVEDCARRRLVVRSSGFATFAADLTPGGGGTLTGVLGIFGSTYQLVIRDLNDVEMDGDRCSGGGVVTIASLRSQFANGTTAITGGTLRGTVISDVSTNNVTGRNLYIQDATGGIVLRFSANHSFALGAQLDVDLTGGTLSEFNGLLQVDGIALDAALVSGQPGDVTPRDATVAEVLANAQAWESTLVRIKDATLGDNTIYNGSVTVTDATGSMVMFTRSQASFANTALPSGVVTVTGIVSEFNAPQLIIRNLTDVTGGGSGGGGDIDESFDSAGSNTDLNLPGWANIAVKGTRLWRGQIFSGNHYAQATAFNDTAGEMETWLITPPIELDVPKKVTFESAYGFYVHDGLSVWISTNFDGTNVTAATWQPLGGNLAESSDTEHAFIPSGDVDLSGFTGTVRIGFKYVGSGPGGQTTSWRVDNIKVTNL